VNAKPSKSRFSNRPWTAYQNAPLGLSYGMNVSTLTMQMQAALQQFAQALFHTSASMQSFANAMQALGFDPAIGPITLEELDYSEAFLAGRKEPEIRVLKCGDSEVREVVGTGFVKRLDRIESLEERLGKQGTRVL
jgi:hypothetical protein